MNRLFHAYAPYVGDIPGRHTGALLSNGDGEAVAYAIFNLQDRGPMFIEHGTKVYAGMIIGEHTRGNDLELNVIKGKKLTNVRASGKDEAVVLTPPIKMSLEKALAYVGDDELVEITPEVHPPAQDLSRCQREKAHEPRQGSSRRRVITPRDKARPDKVRLT